MKRYGNIVQAIAIISLGTSHAQCLAQEMEELTTFKAHSNGVERVVFSPDGRTLASTDGETIRLWETASCRERTSFKGHENSKWATVSITTSIAFSPDGKILVSTGHDDTIMLWDVLRNKERRKIEGRKLPVGPVSFNPDGTKLLASSAGDVMLWEVSTGKNLVNLRAFSGFVLDARFSPDGRYVATSGSDRGKEGRYTTSSIKLWNLATGRSLATFADEAVPTDMVFHPDGGILASICYGRKIELWEMPTGKKLSVFTHSNAVGSVCFSPDGKILASTSKDCTISLWEICTGKVITSLRRAHIDYSLAFSPNGKILACGSSDGTVTFWRLGTPAREGCIFNSWPPRTCRRSPTTTPGT
jgi:WD40 repeat protein